MGAHYAKESMEALLTLFLRHVSVGGCNGWLNYKLSSF